MNGTRVRLIRPDESKLQFNYFLQTIELLSKLCCYFSTISEHVFTHHSFWNRFNVWVWRVPALDLNQLQVNY